MKQLMQAARRLLCQDASEEVYLKLVRLILQLLSVRQKAAASEKVMQHLTMHARLLFEGTLALDWWQRVKQVRDEAERQTYRCKQEGMRRWRAWARAAVEGGSSRCHKYMKAVQYQEAWDAVSLAHRESQLPGDDQQWVADPFAMADREWKVWRAIWTHHKDNPERLPRVAPEDSGSLPQLTPKLLDEALLRFKHNTAVGHELLGPRALLDLSMAGKWALCKLLTKCEDLQMWPSSRLLSVMVGLPKPDGGCRLIALMPTLLRVWGRMRLPVAQQWEAANDDRFLWGEQGRSSTGAAMAMLASAESAQLAGGGSVAVLFDLWKCYEVVHHDVLLEEVRHVGFPMLLVKMDLVFGHF